MRQRASIRDYQAWAEGRLFAGRPADDHWMNSPSSGQHTAHYSPVIIAPFVAWGRRGSLPLFFLERRARGFAFSTDLFLAALSAASLANLSSLSRAVFARTASASAT